MRAVILAAGEGARLRPLTQALPKPMLRVANRPIAAYAVEALVANGVRDITIVAGYRREKLQTYFGDGGAFGAKISYVFQDLLLGTAHALAQASTDEEAVVMGGDNVVDAVLVQELLAKRDTIRMATQRSETPSKYGVVTIDKDRVARIEEKPLDYRSEIVNTGVYYFPRGFQAQLTPRIRRGIGGLSLVLQDLIESGGTVVPVPTTGLWMDAVYPWNLLGLNDVLVRRAVGSASSPPEDDVVRGRAATVHRTAGITGPALLGDGVTVDSGVAVGPATSIGDNVTLGANSVVENCILMDDVRVGPGAILRNCIVAEGVTIGPRFTALSGPCEVRAEDGWHSLRDFGCVIGSDAQLGGNVTVEPGVAIGPAARIGSGVWLHRPVEPNAVVQR